MNHERWRKAKNWAYFLLGAAAAIASQQVPEMKKKSDAWIEALRSLFPAQPIEVTQKGQDLAHSSEVFEADWQAKQLDPSQEGEPLAPFLIQQAHFSLAYDAKTKNPIWVFEKLSLLPQEEPLEPQVALILPAHLRAEKKEYERQGLVAASLLEDSTPPHFTSHAICPLCVQLSQGYWHKIKAYGQALLQNHSFVHVITGPLYLSYSEGRRRFVKYEVIGQSEVAVPSHFFKLYLMRDKEGKRQSEAFVFPNRMIPLETPLDAFRTQAQHIEKAAGVLLPPGI